MKKIFLALAVIATVSLVSCKGTDQAAEEEASAVAEAVVDQIDPEDFQAQLDEAVAQNDTAKINELISLSNATYQQLSGTDKTAAEDYLQKIKDIITKNTALTSVVPNATSLVDKVAALPETVKDAATETGKAIVDSTKNAAKQAVNNAKEAAVSKANEAVEKAKAATVDKANEAVENAQKKVNDAASDVQKKAGDAAKKALGL